MAGGLQERYPEIACRLAIIRSQNGESISRQTADTLERYRPSVVGISALSATMLDAIEIAKAVRKLEADIPIVLGGHHPTSFPAGIGRHEMFDYFVIGEGARSGPGLFHRLIQGAGNRDSIPGLSFRRQGQVVITESEERPATLDWLPPLAWDLLDLEPYTSDPHRSAVH